MRKTAAMLAMAAMVLATAMLTGCQSVPGFGPRSEGLDESVPQYMHDAHTYLQRGLTDAALASFGLALEVNNHVTAAHLGMGNIYRHRKQYSFAREAYQSAVKDDPTNFDARYYLGLMDQYLGKLKEAVTSYLAALSIRPNSKRASRDLASTYLQLGMAAEALPYAKQAAKAYPKSQSAWANLGAAYSLTGDYENAVTAYRHAAELGEPAPPVLLGLANAHIQLEHYQRAINTLDTLIHRKPSAVAYERRGYAHFKTGDFSAALSDYQAAMKLAPDDPAALNGVGVSLMTLYIQGGRTNQPEHDQAIKLWRKSLAIDPHQPPIIDLLSRYTNF